MPSFQDKSPETRVAIDTVNYARMVHLDGVEGEGVSVSDNFFDMLPGTSKMIDIHSDRKLRPDAIRLRHWLTPWAE